MGTKNENHNNINDTYKKIGEGRKKMEEIKPLYFDYCKFIYYIRRWQIIKWLFYSILPIVLIIFFYSSPHENNSVPLFQQLIIAFVFALFLIIIWILFNLYHSHLAHHHAKKEGHIPFEFHYNDDGLIVSEKSVKLEIKWERFKKIIETNSMLLFWYDKNNVMWLPKNQISNIIGIKSLIVNNFNGKKKLKL